MFDIFDRILLVFDETYDMCTKRYPNVYFLLNKLTIYEPMIVFVAFVSYSERIGNVCLQCCLLLQFLYVGYRMFFHDRARGEAECEIVKKTFYNVGYILVWLLTYFRFFSKQKVLHFQKNWIQILPNPQFNFNDLKENR